MKPTRCSFLAHFPFRLHVVIEWFSMAIQAPDGIYGRKSFLREGESRGSMWLKPRRALRFSLWQLAVLFAPDAGLRWMAPPFAAIMQALAAIMLSSARHYASACGRHTVFAAAFKGDLLMLYWREKRKNDCSVRKPKHAQKTEAQFDAPA